MFKYTIKYYQCNVCRLIQTEIPYWLDQAYKKAITTTDVGLLGRNISLSNKVFDLLIGNFDRSKKFLDYGGGYGILVRLLRDKGLDFYRQDIYCENMFAVNHDIADLGKEERLFEMATCFEVFEHTHDPYKLFEDIREYASNILISTLLIPDQQFKSTKDWWYFATETGQHITFYTLESLKIIAKNFDMNLYSNGVDLHLFTLKKFNKNPLKCESGIKEKIVHKINNFFSAPQKRDKSLTQSDYDIARAKAFDNKS